MPEGRLPPEYGPRTVLLPLLRARASRAPAALAVAAPFGGVERTFTRQQLDEVSNRLATGLHDRLGIGPGSRVAWLLPNEQAGEALVAYHALLKLGAVNVPINPRLTPTEVATLVEHSGSKTILVAPACEETVHNAGLGGAARMVGIGSEDWDGAFDASLPASAEPSGGWPHVDEEDLACILYTSGTTGLPKGVEHTHASALAAGLAWCDAFSLTATDVVQSPFPIYSGAGLHFNGLAALWADAAFVVDTPEVETALARLARYRSTVYTAVPSIYLYWLDHPARAGADFGSLRVIGYGGATMPTSTILDLRQAFPDLALMQTYGSTEAGPGGTYLPPEYAMARLGSIGNRVAGRFNRVRVVDDAGSDVGPGQQGELLMDGASMMRGYHRDPDATAAVVQDGWVRSGDMVRFDEEGFLYFVDRKRDIIVRGGLNISTVEVEEALLQHPDVSEAAVFAGRHARLGEEVHAAVVLKTGSAIGPDDLIAHCRGLIADFKLPHRIDVRDALPRNASGKVLKRVLAAGEMSET